LFLVLKQMNKETKSVNIFTREKYSDQTI